jgi:hypothetical protein
LRRLPAPDARRADGPGAVAAAIPAAPLALGRLLRRPPGAAGDLVSHPADAGEVNETRTPAVSRGAAGLFPRTGKGIMCFYYDDYPEFSRQEVVKARKSHKCDACRGTIEPGEQYERTSGKFEGYVSTSKMCRRCCYDRYRVVEHELAEGCRWDEAWPADSELVGYLEESEIGQTRPEDVPASFKIGDMPPLPANYRELVARS